MAIKISKNKWKCSYCGKIYPTSFKADQCRSSHDLVYVQISREDLARLVQFLYFKDDSILTPTIIKTLNRYLGRTVILK